LCTSCMRAAVIANVKDGLRPNLCRKQKRALQVDEYYCNQRNEFHRCMEKNELLIPEILIKSNSIAQTIL